VVDKGGPKFAAVASKPEGRRPQAITVAMGASLAGDGFPKIAGPRTIGTSGRDGTTRTKYQERTMAEFASNLGFLIGSSQGKSASEGHLQPRVVDKTGLTERYTFVLEYYDAGLANMARSLPPSDAGAGGSAVPVAGDAGGGPTIFDAVQKQLGLKLVKVASVPMDVIVVDGVDKMLTEN
jgi:uncharacterized protein (TIGR03435 family)